MAVEVMRSRTSVVSFISASGTSRTTILACFFENDCLHRRFLLLLRIRVCCLLERQGIFKRIPDIFRPIKSSRW